MKLFKCAFTIFIIQNEIVPCSCLSILGDSLHYHTSHPTNLVKVKVKGKNIIDAHLCLPGMLFVSMATFLSLFFAQVPKERYTSYNTPYPRQ